MGWCWSNIGLSNWGGWAMSLALLAGALFVLALAAAWLIRSLRRTPRAAAVEADPLEIARRRLAGGEIDVTEFEEIRDQLTG